MIVLLFISSWLRSALLRGNLRLWHKSLCARGFPFHVVFFVSGDLDFVAKFRLVLSFAHYGDHSAVFAERFRVLCWRSRSPRHWRRRWYIIWCRRILTLAPVGEQVAERSLVTIEFDDGGDYRRGLLLFLFLFLVPSLLRS